MGEKLPMDLIISAREETERIAGEAPQKSETMAELGREMSNVAAAELIIRIIEKLHEKIQKGSVDATRRVKIDAYARELEQVMKELSEGRVRLKFIGTSFHEDALRSPDRVFEWSATDSSDDPSRLVRFSLTSLRDFFGADERQALIN